MNLFEYDRASYTVIFREEALCILKFKALFDRDKSKDNDIAVKEMSLIYFVCDLESDFQNIANIDDRIKEVKKEVGLPVKWKVDKTIQAAIDFYNERENTIEKLLYDNSRDAVEAINDVLKNAKEYLEEASDKVVASEKLMKVLTNSPKVMESLSKAKEQLLAKKKKTESNMVGFQEKNTFEDGL